MAFFGAGPGQEPENHIRMAASRQDLFTETGRFQLRETAAAPTAGGYRRIGRAFSADRGADKAFSRQAIAQFLLSHCWTGNIRELTKSGRQDGGGVYLREIDFPNLTAALTWRTFTALRRPASVPAGNLDSMEEQMIIKALERTERSEDIRGGAVWNLAADSQPQAQGIQHQFRPGR